MSIIYYKCRASRLKKMVNKWSCNLLHYFHNWLICQSSSWLINELCDCKTSSKVPEAQGDVKKVLLGWRINTQFYLYWKLKPEYSAKKRKYFGGDIAVNCHLILFLHSHSSQADQFSDFHIRSVLCVPIWNSNHQIIGKLPYLASQVSDGRMLSYPIFFPALFISFLNKIREKRRKKCLFLI